MANPYQTGQWQYGAPPQAQQQPNWPQQAPYNPSQPYAGQQYSSPESNYYNYHQFGQNHQGPQYPPYQANGYPQPQGYWPAQATQPPAQYGGGYSAPKRFRGNNRGGWRGSQPPRNHDNSQQHQSFYSGQPLTPSTTPGWATPQNTWQMPPPPQTYQQQQQQAAFQLPQQPAPPSASPYNPPPPPTPPNTYNPHQPQLFPQHQPPHQPSPQYQNFQKQNHFTPHNRDGPNRRYQKTPNSIQWRRPKTPPEKKSATTPSSESDQGQKSGKLSVAEIASLVAKGTATIPQESSTSATSLPVNQSNQVKNETTTSLGVETYIPLDPSTIPSQSSLKNNKPETGTSSNPFPGLDYLGEDSDDWYLEPQQVNRAFSLGSIVWRPGKYLSRALPSSFVEADEILQTFPPSTTPTANISQFADSAKIEEQTKPIRASQHWRQVASDPAFREVDRIGAPVTLIEARNGRSCGALTEEQHMSLQGRSANAHAEDVAETADRIYDQSQTIPTPNHPEEDESYSPPPAEPSPPRDLKRKFSELETIPEEASMDIDPVTTSKDTLNSPNPLAVGKSSVYNQNSGSSKRSTRPPISFTGPSDLALSSAQTVHSTSTSDVQATQVDEDDMDYEPETSLSNIISYLSHAQPTMLPKAATSPEDIQAKIEAITNAKQVQAESEAAKQAEIQAKIEAITSGQQTASAHVMNNLSPNNQPHNHLEYQNDIDQSHPHPLPKKPTQSVAPIDVQSPASTHVTSPLLQSDNSHQRRNSMPMKSVEFPKDNSQEDILRKLGVTGEAKAVFNMPPPARTDPPPGYERRSRSRSRSASPLKEAPNTLPAFNPLLGIPPPPPPPPPQHEEDDSSADYGMFGRPSSALSQHTAAGSDFQDEVSKTPGNVGTPLPMETIAEEETVGANEAPRQGERSESLEIDNATVERLQKRRPKIPAVYQRRW